MFKRLAAFFAVLLTLAPLVAHAQSIAPNDFEAKWGWSAVYMRNTSGTGAATPAELNWAKGNPGSTIGYLDSTVFRRASAAYTVLDTTVAFPVAELSFPPHLSYKSGTTVLTDTTAALPWIALRVRQDTTSYSYTSNSVMDSIHVAAEWSLDGIRWNSITGTPTKEPSATFFPTGGDGLISLGVKAAEFGIGASDIAQYDFNCVPTLYENATTATAGTFIINRTMCMAPGYIRFIIGGDMVGQYAVELARWKSN